MGETILIVQDNWLSRKLFQDLVTAEGYRPIAAASGNEGIALAGRHLPDLAIIDLWLPDIAGLDVIQALRGDDRLRNIPVLAASAFQSSVSADWLLQHQCDGFVARPVSARAFINEVNRLLRPIATTNEMLPQFIRPSGAGYSTQRLQSSELPENR